MSATRERITHPMPMGGHVIDRRATAWHGMVWYGMAWHAWHGMAWYGMAIGRIGGVVVWLCGCVVVWWTWAGRQAGGVRVGRNGPGKSHQYSTRTSWRERKLPEMARYEIWAGHGHEVTLSCLS